MRVYEDDAYGERDMLCYTTMEVKGLKEKFFFYGVLLGIGLTILGTWVILKLT